MKTGKYVVKEIPIKLRTGGELKDVRKIMIGFHDTTENIVYPHPLTDFIDKKYFNYSNSLNHQKQPAYTIVQFMNFIYYKTKNKHKDFATLKDNGIPGLTLEHGTLFLNYLSEEKDMTKDTFKRKVGHLTKFYTFLVQNEILEKEVHIRSKQKKNSETLIPPFKDVKYPLNKESKKLKKTLSQVLTRIAFN